MPLLSSSNGVLELSFGFVAQFISSVSFQPSPSSSSSDIKFNDMQKLEFVA